MLFFRAAAVPRIFTAVLHCSSATLVQVIMASFLTATASLCGVAINTHPTPPGEAADAPTIPNPSQAI